MNKQEVIKFVAECAGLTHAQALRSIDCYHKAIQGAMEREDRVTMRGFGTFRLRTRKARKLKHPRTGETVQVQETKIPKFIAGKELKEALK